MEKEEERKEKNLIDLDAMIEVYIGFELLFLLLLFAWLELELLLELFEEYWRVPGHIMI